MDHQKEVLVAAQKMGIGQEIEDVFASGDVRGAHLHYARTPAIFRMLGFPDLPLRLPRYVIKKVCTGKDGQRQALSPKQLLAALHDLDDPVAVFRDPSDRGLVILTSVVDDIGNPVVIAIKQDGIERHERVNIVLTAFGRERCDAYIAGLGIGHLLFVGQKNTPALSLSVPDLCRTDEGESGGVVAGQKIYTMEDVRKYKAECWANLHGQ